MFLSTAHLHRVIRSADLALVLLLSTASARAVALDEITTPLLHFSSASNGKLLSDNAGLEFRRHVGTLIGAPHGTVGARINRAATLAMTGGGQAQTAGSYELAFARDGQIFKAQSNGTGLVQLTSEGVNSEPEWAPDGSRIAFVHQGGSSADSEIDVMNADGSNVVQRTNAGAFNASPAWSPDGTRIAFSSLRDGQTRIYVMRVDEDWWNPAPLGFDRGWNAQPAWSPDGTKIAFVSDWRAFDFLYDLYVMNADGSDVRLLLGPPFPPFPPAEYYFEPAWSPDGGTIALTVCAYARDNCFPDSTVALVNADGSGLRSIASAGGYARPSWSPDGSIIAFGSSACRNCTSTIRYVTRDGSASGVLVPYAHSPTWRPSTAGASGMLWRGQALFAHRWRTSIDGRLTLSYRADGNLALYDSSWSPPVERYLRHHSGSSRHAMGDVARRFDVRPLNIVLVRS
jgi:TolB protein